MLIGRASAGVMVLARPNHQARSLDVLESIQVDSTIDNPSYFHDPYAESTGRDASGYLLAGLASAHTWPDGRDPVVVWFVQRASREKGGNGGGWSKRKIFQDNGKTIRSAATAVVVAIDPKENDGKKQGWLYVAGPVAKGIVVSKVDL